MKFYLRAAVSALAIVLMLSACDEHPAGTARIAIQPLIQTRVTGLHFDRDDRIGLTVLRTSNAPMSNCLLTYDGTSFVGDNLLWYNDLNEKSTLTAYHPYSASGVPREFSVATNQTLGCSSSDLLGAVKRDVTPSVAPVAMLFYHLMSQLTIVVTNNSDSAVAAVTIDGLIPTATVDLTLPGVSVKPDVSPASIQAFEVTPDASYRAILVPQQGTMRVTVATHDGKSRSKELSAVDLVGGMRYDLSVVVTNIDLDLSLSGDLNDWQEGGSLDGNGNNGGGSSDLVYENERYKTATIDNRIWMAENLRYVPSGMSVGVGLWYPNDQSSNVATLGMLYDYATATAGQTESPIQGICPAGWHLPDAAELAALLASSERASDFFTCAGFWNNSTQKFAQTKGYLLGTTQSETGKCDCIVCVEGGTPAAGAISVANGISVRCVKTLQ